MLRAFAFDVATLDAERQRTERHRGRAQQFAERLGARATLEMVQIPGGTFTMGAPPDEPASRDAERPQHHVAVPSFFLGKHAVTIAQWRAVMGPLPAAMKMLGKPFTANTRQPVVRVSYDDAQDFCARLSRRSRRAYRLPTEAEWEYACRAGTTTAFAFGKAITRALVNHDGEMVRLSAPNEEHTTTLPVGHLGAANAFGLFDMHGNVWEWCQDFWHGNYDGAPADGSAWTADADKRSRVLRGGSWFKAAKDCRSASRSLSGETSVRSREIGFRVALSAGA